MQLLSDKRKMIKKIWRK